MSKHTISKRTIKEFKTKEYVIQVLKQFIPHNKIEPLLRPFLVDDMTRIILDYFHTNIFMNEIVSYLASQCTGNENMQEITVRTSRYLAYALSYHPEKFNNMCWNLEYVLGGCLWNFVDSLRLICLINKIVIIQGSLIFSTITRKFRDQVLTSPIPNTITFYVPLGFESQIVDHVIYGKNQRILCNLVGKTITKQELDEIDKTKTEMNFHGFTVKSPLGTFNEMEGVRIYHFDIVKF